MTRYMSHVVRGEPSLKNSAPQRLRFVIYDTLNILGKRLTELVTKVSVEQPQLNWVC